MEHDPKVHSHKCPKCGHGMEEVTHGELAIDRCTNCHGLWFDEDEHHQLKLAKGGHALDAGDPKEGWKWDTVEEVDCPICGKRMEKVAIPDQKAIWVEECPGHGIFMDAGEFTDFKDKTLLDWFRGIIKGTRGEVL